MKKLRKASLEDFYLQDQEAAKLYGGVTQKPVVGNPTPTLKFTTPPTKPPITIPPGNIGTTTDTGSGTVGGYVNPSGTVGGGASIPIGVETKLSSMA